MTFSVEADMCNIKFNNNIPAQDILQSQCYAKINFTIESIWPKVEVNKTLKPCVYLHVVKLYVMF